MTPEQNKFNQKNLQKSIMVAELQHVQFLTVKFHFLTSSVIRTKSISYVLSLSRNLEGNIAYSNCYKPHTQGVANRHVEWPLTS